MLTRKCEWFPYRAYFVFYMYRLKIFVKFEINKPEGYLLQRARLLDFSMTIHTWTTRTLHNTSSLPTLPLWIFTRQLSVRMDEIQGLFLWDFIRDTIASMIYGLNQVLNWESCFLFEVAVCHFHINALIFWPKSHDLCFRVFS